jgi:hypothetical protein
LVVVVELVVVVVVSCDALLCDCGFSDTLLEEPVVPLGLVDVAVPELGVWFCGGVVLWLWSGVALLAGGFSGVPVVVEVDGLATLPLALEDGEAEDWDEDAAGDVEDWDDCADAIASVLGLEETPDPSAAEGGVQVSARCFTLVAVKLLFDIVEDCVWPVLLAEAEAVASLPVAAPVIWTCFPTSAFRSAVEPLIWYVVPLWSVRVKFPSLPLRQPVMDDPLVCVWSFGVAGIDCVLCGCVLCCELDDWLVVSCASATEPASKSVAVRVRTFRMKHFLRAFPWAKGLEVAYRVRYQLTARVCPGTRL